MNESYFLMERNDGRWIILHPVNPMRAWSGSRWVPTCGLGFPAGEAQVSNFESEEVARLTARAQIGGVERQALKVRQ